MDQLTRLKDLAVSDSGFVFDPYSGSTFSLNQTGLVLVRGIQSGLDRNALMEQLTEHFEVGEADLYRDIDEFVQLLRENGVVSAEFVIE